jgi:small subunit ribosomal protein S17
MAKKNDKADKSAGGKGGAKTDKGASATDKGASAADKAASGKTDRPAETKPAEKAGKGESGQGKGGKGAEAKADKVEKSTEKAPEPSGAKEGDKPTGSLAARMVEGVKEGVKSVAHAIAEKLGIADAVPAAQEQGKRRGFRRRMVGRVTSDKMDKTVTVEVIRDALDPVYKKYVRRRERYKAHDETNQYKVGDRVEITEHRPISRDKRWLVTRLVNRPVEE